MDTLSKNSPEVNCHSEYDILHRVLICQPEYMAYEVNNINIDVAMKQHQQFEEILKAHGIEVIKLPLSEKFPEQVYTRDIGFTVGEDIFVAEMASKVRQGEEKVLEEWLDSENIPFHTTNERVEGGDIMVDQDMLYVGVSKRTSEEVVQWLVLRKIRLVAITQCSRNKKRKTEKRVSRLCYLTMRMICYTTGLTLKELPQLREGNMRLEVQPHFSMQ